MTSVTPAATSSWAMPRSASTSVIDRPPPSPPSAVVIVRSLSRDSSHSRPGSESATIPQPANSVASRPATRPQRSATISSPSPSAPSQPIGPAYQPRSKPSCSAMRSSATSRGAPPTAGVGWSWPPSDSRPASSRSVPVIGVTRCWTCRSGRIAGLSATWSDSTIGARPDRSVSTTTACSSRSFSLASRPAAQPGVLVGIGAARRRPGDRDGLERAPDRPHEPFRRRPEERRAVAGERERRALGRARRQVAEGGDDVEVGRRPGRDPARQHDLVDPATPDRPGEEADGPLPAGTIRPFGDDLEGAGRGRGTARGRGGGRALLAGRRFAGEGVPPALDIGRIDVARGIRGDRHGQARRPASCSRHRTSAGPATPLRTAPRDRPVAGARPLKPRPPRRVGPASP